MTANDEDGGESELWSIIETMGYNKQLKLTKVNNNIIIVYRWDK